MQPSTRIVIALAALAPLSGELEAPGQPNRPFVGWLGLLSALQAAAETLAGAVDPQEPR